jgi:hypothetical protein
MPRPYEIVAPLTVYEVLRRMRRSHRQEVERFLHRLVDRPALSGDFEAPADDGRIHQVKIVGGWIVSYWIDHAACEVRVTSLELIE